MLVDGIVPLSTVLAESIYLQLSKAGYRIIPRSIPPSPRKIPFIIYSDLYTSKFVIEIQLEFFNTQTRNAINTQPHNLFDFAFPFLKPLNVHFAVKIINKLAWN